MLQKTTRTSLRPRRRSRRPEDPHPPAGADAAQPFSSRDRIAADRPQDRATYGCDCGYVFQASVSTSVRCPHCGETQPW